MYVYLIYFYIALSVIAFFSYAIDKRRARKKRYRISEAFLLCIGFFGGSVGALLAMNLFHHKTSHWYFWGINVLGLFVQATALYWIWYIKL